MRRHRYFTAARLASKQYCGAADTELKKQFNAKLAAQERKRNREIAKLKDKKVAATQPISWKLDVGRFRAIPFYSDGRPGVAINLRPLFAQYNDEVS